MHLRVPNPPLSPQPPPDLLSSAPVSFPPIQLPPSLPPFQIRSHNLSHLYIHTYIHTYLHQSSSTPSASSTSDYASRRPRSIHFPSTGLGARDPSRSRGAFAPKNFPPPPPGLFLRGPARLGSAFAFASRSWGRVFERRKKPSPSVRGGGGGRVIGAHVSHTHTRDPWRGNVTCLESCRESCLIRVSCCEGALYPRSKNGLAAKGQPCLFLTQLAVPRFSP